MTHITQLENELTELTVCIQMACQFIKLFKDIQLENNNQSLNISQIIESLSKELLTCEDNYLRTGQKEKLNGDEINALIEKYINSNKNGVEKFKESYKQIHDIFNQDLSSHKGLSVFLVKYKNIIESIDNKISNL